MKKKPEVLFIFPGFNDGYFKYNLGSSYIISYLRQKGIYSEQFLNYSGIRIKDFLKGVLAKNPKIIGFTCYDKNYFLVKLLASRLKSSRPDLLIIAGGPTATFSDEVILKNIPEVDLCVRGEGELAAYEIVDRLNGKSRAFSNISGITYRNGNEIIKTPDRSLLEELDSIPSPYLSGILDPHKIFRNKDSVSIITSRGCIYNCTFCNCSAISRHRIRYHSVGRVISELEMINRLSRHKDDFLVWVYDDTFTLDERRVEEICRQIIKNRIDLNIRILTRADYLNKEILRLLFEAGVREISFSLESAVPRILYNIKKVRFSYNGCTNNFNPEKRFIKRVKESVGLAKKIGFRVYTSIIFGLPGETRRDGLRTINFIRKLNLDGYYHNYLNIFAGTELFNNFIKDKFDISEPRIRYPLAACKKGVFLYNIFKIPLLNNEAHYSKLDKSSLFSLTSSLSGLYKNEGKGINIQDVVLACREAPAKWLIDNCFIQSRIIFGSKIEDILMQREHRFRINILSLSKALCLADEKNKENFSIDRLRRRYNKIASSYYAFKRYKSFSEFVGKPEIDRDIIFGISDNTDLDALERLLSNGTLAACENYTKGKLNYILLDGCRWLDFCPALKLNRIIIDPEHNLRPCFYGRIIGKAGDDLNKVRQGVIEYWQYEKEKRGCDDCPVKDSCSQCPFLGKIDSNRYCEIRRRYNPILSKFINLLQFKRTIKTYLDTKT